MGGSSGFSPYLLRYAGTAVLAYASPREYESYILFHSVSLLVCGMTILVVTFDAIKQRPSRSTASIVGYLEVLLAIAVVCTGLSYRIVLKTITPPFYVYDEIFYKLFVICMGVCAIHNPLMKRYLSRLPERSRGQPLIKQFTDRGYFRTEYFWPAVKLYCIYFMGLFSLFGFFSK